MISVNSVSLPASCKNVSNSAPETVPFATAFINLIPLNCAISYFFIIICGVLEILNIHRPSIL